MVTTEVTSPVRDESVTEQKALEVTSELSVTPVVDPWIDESEEEVATEVPSNNDPPVEQIVKSDSEAGEPVAGIDEILVSSEESKSRESV